MRCSKQQHGRERVETVVLVPAGLLQEKVAQAADACLIRVKCFCESQRDGKRIRCRLMSYDPLLLLVLLISPCLRLSHAWPTACGLDENVVRCQHENCCGKYQTFLTWHAQSLLQLTYRGNCS